MCGINGFLINKNIISREECDLVVHRMNEKLYHRGPDAGGMEIFESKNNYIALGHRRLSIIDLSTNANQPLQDIEGKLWIVYNGEIYNYIEVRKDLIKKGYSFKTNSDTEVILNAYKFYGHECLKKLNGIFAFSIYNKNNGEIFIARDRVGVKPLVYAITDDYLIFSSEIKAILEHPYKALRDIDFTALNYYFTIGYIPAPLTIYKNIKKLEPGHYAVIGDSVKIVKYWQPDYHEDHSKPYSYFLEGLKYHINRAVKLQLVSDVPVGAFLSGGIDSSAVVSLMAKQCNYQIKTFSIGFEDKDYNELSYARVVAESFNTDHYERIFEPDPQTMLSDFVSKIDEPFADTSSIPTFLVSKIASREVKVVLSGDGGDELFAGYDWHIANYFIQKTPKYLQPIAKKIVSLSNYYPYNTKKKSIINILQKLSNGWGMPDIMYSMKWHCIFDEEEKDKLFKNQYGLKTRGSILDFEHYLPQKSQNRLQDYLFFDLLLYLPNDDLTKVDMMSMANSIENRVPLLDHKLIEFAAKIPYKYKNIGRNTKQIFKEAVKDVLPFEIAERKKKQGFSIPFSGWLHNVLKEYAKETILNSNSDLLDKNRLIKLLDDHLKFKRDNGAKLRTALIYLNWEQNNTLNY